MSVRRGLALVGILAGPTPALAAVPWGPEIISDVAERVTPAVVSLTARVDEGAPGEGSGSAVILAADGLLVTSHHLVAEARAIWVTLADGRRFGAELVGGDASTDVALLRIEARGLPTLPLGDARELRLGQWVMAVGNPFDVGQTVTLGIVSANRRSAIGILEFEDFVQTDAAINPGNSGGALVNLQGRLVGISTSILSRTGGAQGVGFAIPTHVVTWVRDQVLKEGRVRHGWLGLQVQPTEPELRPDLPSTVGLLVTDVVGEPARRAGLRVGDVITHVNEEALRDPAQLRSRVGLSSPGTRIRLRIERAGRRLVVEARVGEQEWVEPPPVVDAPASSRKSGVRLERLGDAERRRLAGTTEGWVVRAIDRDSPADRCGLQLYDVVFGMNGRTLGDPEELETALQERGRVVLRVERRGAKELVVLRR